MALATVFEVFFAGVFLTVFLIGFSSLTAFLFANFASLDFNLAALFLWITLIFAALSNNLTAKLRLAPVGLRRAFIRASLYFSLTALFKLPFFLELLKAFFDDLRIGIYFEIRY